MNEILTDDEWKLYWVIADKCTEIIKLKEEQGKTHADFETYFYKYCNLKKKMNNPDIKHLHKDDLDNLLQFRVDRIFFALELSKRNQEVEELKEELEAEKDYGDNWIKQHDNLKEKYDDLLKISNIETKIILQQKQKLKEIEKVIYDNNPNTPSYGIIKKILGNK